MVDRGELTRELVAFSRALTGRPGLDAVLPDLAARLTRVLGTSGTSLSVASNGALRFVAADAEAVASLAGAQAVNQQGPGVDALRSGLPIRIRTVAAQGGRWPQYARTAVSLGIEAVASIPLHDAGQTTVIELVDTRSHDWLPDELDAANAFGQLAADYLHHARELESERRTVEQLRHALDARMVIEQAKGIIAAQRRITVEEAFTVLCKHANDRDVTLRAVADAVVRLGLRP